jgi:thiol-disulfide isomerase/thioredoxin
MNKIKLYIFCFLAAAYFGECGGGRAGFTRIVVHTSAPINSKLYITNIPMNDEKRITVDSAIVVNNRDSVVLYVPGKVQGLYTVSIKGQRLRIDFIADAPVIRIHANYFSNTYTLTGSPASIGLRNFNDNQGRLAQQLRDMKKAIDSLKLLPANKLVVDTLNKHFLQKLQDFYQQYKNYADTVKSPAAFMAVNNYIDFGADYKPWKKFILHAAARFPYYQPIQAYTKDVLATIRIYELEYMVGDKLPFITLPDQDGKLFSTSTLAGQYYLIDFWSTLCGQCIAFKEAERKVVAGSFAGKLQIVSVAIDDEKPEWKKMISSYKYNWIQLIDVKLWQGPAARTLVFDSIPFNFLVAPNGKIIKKAIKPDSLLKVISTLKPN